jgi:hypothetical protein
VKNIWLFVNHWYLNELKRSIVWQLMSLLHL